MHTTPSPSPRLSRELLLQTFHGYGAPKERWLLGGEFERAIVRPDGRPVAYDDPDGIRWILESLAEGQAGWTRKHEDGQVIALQRPDGSNITLEPGGQVELSGAPHRTVAALAAELAENRDFILQLVRDRDLRWTACGLTPVAAIEDIPWMPKGRYRIMRDYLPGKGDLALFMMKGTSSVQCNYDFADEADCAAKVRLCSGVAPLTTAIFSNSPLYKNQPTGFLSYRGHIWTRTDPDRTGFPPGLRADYSHARWLDYLLDVPMMFYQREGRWLAAEGRSFRTFMERGFDGHFPSMDDWDLHMTSVFPEVRIKRTIEVRGADCVASELAVAFCALFAGLLYSESALSDGLELVAELERHGTHAERFASACKHGLGGALGGRPTAEWAQELVGIARKGLADWNAEDLPWLAPLEARVAAGRSPAVDLLEAWQRDPRPESVIEAIAY
jgi:glutamate--cysteine ligase